jgi:hypothetical protein
MFNVNREAREFLEKNYITLRNGFQNEGLILYNAYYFSAEGLEKLELHIREVCKRNILNRNVSISLSGSDVDKFV